MISTAALYVKMSESDSDEHGRLASLASSGTNGLGSLGGSDADDVASTVAAADLDDERPLLLIIGIPEIYIVFWKNMFPWHGADPHFSACMFQH